MRIDINNCSSPGASFTENTNRVLICTLQWIRENNYPVIEFKTLRTILEKKYGVNNNNARNIYPLLKNCGFINYSKGVIETEHFFSKTGLAYVLALETISLLNSDEDEKVIREAKMKADTIIKTMILNGLYVLQSNPETNYAPELRDFMRYLLRYGKADKKEFAYLLYERKRNDNFLDTMHALIQRYRDGIEDIEVVVKVRDDTCGEGGSNIAKRAESIAFLTSYNYFTNLLKQAGLIEKGDGCYIVVENKRKSLQELSEVDCGGK